MHPVAKTGGRRVLAVLDRIDRQRSRRCGHHGRAAADGGERPARLRCPGWPGDGGRLRRVGGHRPAGGRHRGAPSAAWHTGRDGSRARRRTFVDTGNGLVRAARHGAARSEEHTSELQSRVDLVCRLLLEKKKKNQKSIMLKKKNKRYIKEY